MAAAVACATSSEAARLMLVPPPASPFAELLRRSRFASYDPAIRQTYSAPSGHAHRGDWGLKRPIALRRRNAFISLTSFESPAQYTEWNNAENQVRFIRRIEEMGVKPAISDGTPWEKSVGRWKTQWFVDSEFCPEEGHELDQESRLEEQKKEMPLDLGRLGQKGRGHYGANRGAPETGRISHVTPNINAMPPKEFRRYLEKLRKLRPAFREFIEEESKNSKKNLAGKTLYAVAQNTGAAHHRNFLMRHVAAECADLTSHKLEQLPHPNAGLTYHHPSPLDVHFTAKPQPGFVLNVHTTPRGFSSSNHGEMYAASFGGLSAVLHKRNAGGKRPLIDLESEEGIDQSRLDESIANMQLVPKGLVLRVPPKIVGQRAEGLKGVRMAAEVMINAKTDFTKDNPYWPGSFNYNAAEPVTGKARPRDFTRRPQRVKATSWAEQKQGVLGTVSAGATTQLFSVLKNITGQGEQEGKDKWGASDEGL